MSVLKSSFIETCLWKKGWEGLGFKKETLFLVCQTAFNLLRHLAAKMKVHFEASIPRPFSPINILQMTIGDSVDTCNKSSN